MRRVFAGDHRGLSCAHRALIAYESSRRRAPRSHERPAGPCGVLPKLTVLPAERSDGPDTASPSGHCGRPLRPYRHAVAARVAMKESRAPSLRGCF